MEKSDAETTRVLGLFAKWPVAGQVKTRLARETSAEWAGRVADAFLRDSVQRFATTEARRVLAFTPPEAEDRFAELVSNRFTLVPQADGDLGQRMSTFLTQQLASGADAVVLLGADSPTLPPEFVERAFQELETADVVLGPATDGGYYLLGVARRLPPIFDGIAWGTAGVLAETMSRLDPGWRLALLPPWYDVDTLDDWRLLRGHLAALRRAGTPIHLPHTEALEEPRTP